MEGREMIASPVALRAGNENPAISQRRNYRNKNEAPDQN